jgi:hypothetical protein
VLLLLLLLLLAPFLVGLLTGLCLGLLLGLSPMAISPWDRRFRVPRFGFNSTSTCRLMAAQQPEYRASSSPPHMDARNKRGYSTRRRCMACSRSCCCLVCFFLSATL